MSEVPLISIVDDDALARDGIRELVESLRYRSSLSKRAFSMATLALKFDIVFRQHIVHCYRNMAFEIEAQDHR